MKHKEIVDAITTIVEATKGKNEKEITLAIYEIGKILKHGDKKLLYLGWELIGKYNTTFHSTELKKMRKFAKIYEKEEVEKSQLNWKYYRHLVRVNEKLEDRQWYEDKIISENWSTELTHSRITFTYQTMQKIKPSMPMEQFAETYEKLENHGKDTTSIYNDECAKCFAKS